MDDWIAHIRQREKYDIYVPTMPVPIFDLVCSAIYCATDYEARIR